MLKGDLADGGYEGYGSSDEGGHGDPSKGKKNMMGANATEMYGVDPAQIRVFKSIQTVQTNN